MTDFKDFLDQIKIRLTNPLIFSFLISWVIIHWQIFVGGFYLTTDDLKKLGHDNFLEFIAGNINWCNGFWYPLFSALIYTFLSPVIRIGIQYFNTWINKKGNNQIQKVASESFIPYEMYDKLLEEVQIQRKRNESLVTESISLSNEIEDKKQELRDNSTNINQLQTDVHNLQVQYNSMFDSSGLNGYWEVRLKDINHDIIWKSIIKIKGNVVEEKQMDGHFHPKFNIRDFSKQKTGEMSFLMYDSKQTDAKNERQFHYYSRLKEEGAGKLEGRYDNLYDITFERQSDDDLVEPLFTIL